MKKTKTIIGIDVSKATLDVYIHSTKKHFIVSNDTKGFTSLLEIIMTSSKYKVSDLFICFECTGRYSKMLAAFLQSEKITFVMASALDIKKSLGLTRGKDDKIDAKRIATYAHEKFDRLKPTILPGRKIDQIKSLLSLREKLIKHRTAYKNGICDLFDCYSEGETDLIRDIQKRQIEKLTEEIELIEETIKDIIRNDESLKANYKLIISIKGVGQIIAFYVIAITENFTTFSNHRSFACYAGIAPFAYSSGTVKGKSHVHQYANKQIKSLLNMGAMSAIQYSREIKLYYDKRVNAGKNKMSTINIIRNKIVSRIFAVVRRGTPYIDIHKYAA